MCGNAFVSSGATAAHMKAVHKILGPRAKPFEETKVREMKVARWFHYEPQL